MEEPLDLIHISIKKRVYVKCSYNQELRRKLHVIAIFYSCALLICVFLLLLPKSI